MYRPPLHPLFATLLILGLGSASNGSAAEASGLGDPVRLTASDGFGADLFGDAVGVSGGTLVIGARGDNSRTGAAYVFELDETGVWIEQKKLTASDAATGSFFGDAVAISGDTIVVGASLRDGVSENSGAAYLFERHHGGPNNWGEVARLTASDAAANDELGDALALDGNTLIVGLT